MPVVKISPKDEQTEDMLADIMAALRPELKEVICRIAETTESDVIIDLMKCAIRDADPVAVPFVLYADTCPNEKLEPRADEMRNEIAKVLAFHGLSVGTGTEVWFRFLAGSWGLIKDGVIRDEDAVSHPWTPPGSLEPFFSFQPGDPGYTIIRINRRCLATSYAMHIAGIGEKDLEDVPASRVASRVGSLERIAQRCQKRLNKAGLGDI